ncbi:MAG: hypothetical protein ABSE68_01350 [Minisyncoccia bacterium]
MNKNIIVAILVVVILAIGAYFIFIKQGSAPATNSIPAGGQPNQTPVAYTDASSFSQSFLRCIPSELKMPFPGNSTYVITVFGVENGNCHYATKVVGQNGAAVSGAGGVDCKVPEGLISTSDILGHLFGVDKGPGREAMKAEQDKIEANYCKK